MSSSDLAEKFREKVIDTNLVEKWLDFYAMQLKQDLAVHSDFLIRNAELLVYNENRKVQPNMSIMNSNETRKDFQIVDSKKNFKSKPILDSITMLLLLLNKSSRLVNKFLNENKKCEDKKVSFFQKNLNVQNFNLDNILSSLVQSVEQIIDHLSYLNKNLTYLEKEQESIQEFQTQSKPDFFLNNLKRANGNLITESNFITLKQSNHTVKELHSITNTLMILIVSINDLENLNDSKKLIKDLIFILEKLISDEFNYFPAILNLIQLCLSHLVGLNSGDNVCFLEKNEGLLKKMVQSCCRILSKSINNLEDGSNPRLTRDTSLTFVINNNLFKFIVNNFSENYWQNELAECCMMQCLYAVFEKCIYDPKNYDIIYSIVDLFFTFSDKQAESLAKTDFNTRTCLLVSKLFEYSSHSSVSFFLITKIILNFGFYFF